MKLKRFFAFKFNLSFKRFRSRLLFYIIGLLLLTLAGVFGVIDQMFRQNTEETIRHELLVTERIFLRLLQERSTQLTQQATALASDFAFKRVMATQDNATISSALTNLSHRANADAAFLLAIDYRVMVDNLHLQNTEFATELIKQAEKQGKATRLILINQIPYQVIVVPVLAPEPIAWLCLGFTIDDTVLAQLKQLTQVEISLLSQQNANLQLHASTLTTFATQTLSAHEINADGFFWRSGNELYLSRLLTLEQNKDTKIIALIERSWQKALENFYRLEWLLLIIALISIALVSLAALWLAKTVSKPVQLLARGVQAIEQGDYSYQVQYTGCDEIGKLGVAFNNMGVQLLEKEKIRTLLGKVVSPAVANELLSHDVVLGGETREITALFTDLAGFTSIAETMTAQDLVALLNDYLTHMSGAISQHAGVLDKFIGDAIVAFWGAPVDDDLHAQHAVYCALAMQQTLQQLRAAWQQCGLPLLTMRIGINTGYAVVGNVGSIDRLDYTMIGDTVNLAARLEGANKYYGSEILISQYTYERIKAIFLCRELDSVRVQGKQQSVAIYEVLAEKNSVTPEQQALCLAFANALSAFRNQQFELAKILFTELIESHQDEVSALYLQRLATLETNATQTGFDAVYDLSK
jgi:adenylate cyclase